MYLSRLKLNPKNRKVLKEISNIYMLHKTLMRAFPDKMDGGPGRVLFRLDDTYDGPIILVQSTKEPTWDKIDTDPDYLLEEPDKKRFEPTLRNGQVLAFRLVANPTVKKDKKRLGILKEEELWAWFKRKAEMGGFSIVKAFITPLGFMKCGEGDKDISLYSVKVDGVLRVDASERFQATLENGIGSGKAFGFGLLSIAPNRG